MSGHQLARYTTDLAMLALAVMLANTGMARADDDKAHAGRYRGVLGSSTWKVRTEGGKTFLWAGGDRSGPGSQWYDFTDAKIPAAQLQFGIGKDRIRAIDDPLFVSPDDPRLSGLPASPYRPEEKRESNDDIMVIGYVKNDEARAYPTALLDRHELVNDTIGGKPVAIGW